MRDAIDEIHDQWRSLRPGLDVSGIEIIGRVNRLARIVQRRSDDLLRHHGLTRADFDVLAALVRSDRPLTPTQLADHTLLSAPAITKRTKGLVGAGLVERRDNPDDGRGYLLAPSDTGRATIADVLPLQLGLEAALVNGLDPGLRAHVVGGLRALLIDAEAPPASAGESSDAMRRGEAKERAGHGT
ncbi:MarR family winged helix-turn-helix transcriptional regulator [Frigoribacterium sp. 2-23]|uniref:MarR family winged helix-turn-helix transcriptional regulator n=1 Tax=Frigoribacterium sp. 2-23 TaxID=3415006 RepID=UPI003C702556